MSDLTKKCHNMTFSKWSGAEAEKQNICVLLAIKGTALNTLASIST